MDDHSTERELPAAAAIEQRISLVRGELLSYLRRRLPEEAEELAQETWLRVVRASPDCPDDASFRAYVFTVARRLLVDRHRRRAARIQLVAVDGGLPEVYRVDDQPDQVVAAGELLSVVERTLAGMNPDVAAVFRWRMSEDVSFREIARRQGVPVNTALGRMFRATKALAAVLAAEGWMPDGGGS